MTGWYPFHPSELTMTVEVREIAEGDWSYAVLKTGRMINRWASPEFENDPEAQERRRATDAVIRKNQALDREQAESPAPSGYLPSTIDDRFEDMLDRVDAERE